jgi:3-methyladenine DNA glycosylase/8-oxoguanine DNA glycosylase
MRYWPSAETIAASTIEELKTKAKLGYRSANLTAIAKALQNGFPTMDELCDLGPEKAKKKLSYPARNGRVLRRTHNAQDGFST